MKTWQLVAAIIVCFPLFFVAAEWFGFLRMIAKDIGKEGFIVIGLSVLAILALAFCLLLVVWFTKWLWVSLPV
jgi:hypothetical protein